MPVRDYRAIVLYTIRRIITRCAGEGGHPTLPELVAGDVAALDFPYALDTSGLRKCRRPIRAFAIESMSKNGLRRLGGTSHADEGAPRPPDAISPSSFTRE